MRFPMPETPPGNDSHGPRPFLAVAETFGTIQYISPLNAFHSRNDQWALHPSAAPAARRIFRLRCTPSSSHQESYPMSTGWIVLGVLVILVLFAIAAYNRLVALGQRVGQAFADIDVQLKQRHDLIPNLIETVKGYAAHERGTLDDVVKARNGAMSAQGTGHV